MTIHKITFVRVVAAAMIVLAMATPLGFAQNQMKPVAEQLATAFDHYTQADFEKGIDLANQLLQRQDLLAKDSAAIFSILSMCNYALGQDFINKSISYLEHIVRIDPCIIHLPHEFWPQELRDRWFRILQANAMLTCPEGEKIRTIAIMEFDNFSVGEYQEQLGYISKGLADFFASDFAKFSAIKVVERDKINAILSELELQKSDKVDQATAVKAGKMLGATIMVFGSITQLDARSMRMVVRAVDVETSEIITSVDREGKPDYFKMEKELVEELAKKLDVKFDESTKDLLKAGGTESVDATTLYSRGLDFADKYDYKNAYESFRKAFDLDNSFAEAKRKMEIYKPLAG
jgi:TolB-like protein